MMPNHIHGIIVLGTVAIDEGAASGEGAASSAPTLGRVVRVFKSLSAIASNKIMNTPGQQFWQRNYYDHIVRDEHEMNVIRQYIKDNPLKWDQDPDNPVNR